MLLSFDGVAVRSRTNEGLKFPSISLLNLLRAWWLSSTTTTGSSLLTVCSSDVSSASSTGEPASPKARATAARPLFSRRARRASLRPRKESYENTIMVSCSNSAAIFRFCPFRSSSFVYISTRPLKSASRRIRYGCDGSLSALIVCSRIASDGTSHATAFIRFAGSPSKIVFKAQQAIKVLPPPVGTLRQTSGTPAIMF